MHKRSGVEPAVDAQTFGVKASTDAQHPGTHPSRGREVGRKFGPAWKVWALAPGSSPEGWIIWEGLYPGTFSHQTRKRSGVEAPPNAQTIRGRALRRCANVPGW